MKIHLFVYFFIIGSFVLIQGCKNTKLPIDRKWESKQVKRGVLLHFEKRFHFFPIERMDIVEQNVDKYLYPIGRHVRKGFRAEVLTTKVDTYSLFSNMKKLKVREFNLSLIHI